jgi:cytoskeletal protein CcmA (bactofilin family)
MGIFGKTDNRPVEGPRPVTAPTAPAAPAASSATSAPSPAPNPAPAPAPARSAPAAAVAHAATTTCLIGPKTRIKGDITGDENVNVEGYVEGSIKITRDLHVGTAGTVKATVVAQSVVVAGELLGDCQATQRVHIEPTGRVSGNIRAPRVVILEGASFRGNSDMSQRRDGQA